MKKITTKILTLAVSLALALPLAPTVFAEGEEQTTTDPSSILPLAGEEDTEASPDASGEVVEDQRGSEESISENPATTTEEKTNPTPTPPSEEARELDTASSTAEAGAVEIQTGDAGAAANVVNLVNTNFFNSSVWILFLNNFFQLLLGDIDLGKILASEPTYGGNSTGPECDPLLSTCLGGGTLGITNGNTAEIENDIVVRSQSGANLGEGGAVGIDTGDAGAAANVVNLANTNVINSNYVLLTINNFSDWVGDLVLPTGEKLQELLAPKTSGSGAATTTLTNENEGTIGNNVSATGNTGENSAEAPQASIDTGQALAWSNIINNLNQNLVGGTSLYLVFRVYGDWIGEVWNAPEGVSWSESGGAIEISGALPGTPGMAGMADPANIAVTNTNSALIQNNVSVSALTGANRASGETAANIHTGNAFSVANVVNMANTNIFGKNWIVAIINIFGNWRGNVTFGRPNLWIGSRAEIVPTAERPDKARNGSPVQFHYTMANNGDAPASGVVVRQRLGKFLSFISADHGGAYDPATGEISWSIGELLPGATFEVGSSAGIDWELPWGDSMLESTTTISSAQSDGNATDNTDILKVVAHRTESYGGPYMSSNPLPLPVFAIRKSVQFATTTASSTLAYRIGIRNSGGPAKNAVLLDVITDEQGKVLREKKWVIGDIKQDEEIRVEYSVLWTASTRPGKYTNTAQLMAMGGYPHTGPGEGVPVFSAVASTTIEVLAGPNTQEILMTPTETTEPLTLATPIILPVASLAPQTPTDGAVIEEEILEGDNLYSKFSVPTTTWNASTFLAGLGALPESHLARDGATISLALLSVVLITSLYFRRKEEWEM